MKLITRDTDYAIQALCYIAKQPEQFACVDALVQELGMPRSFMRKILQVLNKEGVLVSLKGKGGGFYLQHDPETVKIMDIIQIFQGEIQLTACLLQKQVCPNVANCKFKKVLDGIEDHCKNQLRKITLLGLIS